jgi:hydrogenase maturation protease
MNRTLANRVADAVLYEGYILYPYRPSVKNRQRWTFGALYPEAYCRAGGSGEAPENRTECLLRGDERGAVEVVVRFLHLTNRRVEAPAEGAEPRRFVEALRAGERVFQSWQEAEEREVAVGECELGSLLEAPHRQAFALPRRHWREPITGEGAAGGVLDREQHELSGAVELSAARVGEGLYKLAVIVRNLTALDAAADRDGALLRSLVSTHALLGVRGGEWLSLTDPPDDARAAAAACRNVGAWPVLVGEEGARDTLLSAPIILPDYPRIAPESPGDLFDGTEIDEILSLRVLTLTDDERRLAAAVDERARALLARTEALGEGGLLGLHGTIRDRRSVPEATDG